MVGGSDTDMVGGSDTDMVGGSDMVGGLTWWVGLVVSELTSSGNVADEVLELCWDIRLSPALIVQDETASEEDECSTQSCTMSVNNTPQYSWHKPIKLSMAKTRV